MSTGTFIRRCTLISAQFYKHYGYSKNYQRLSSTLSNPAFNYKYCQSRIDPKYCSYNALKLFSTERRCRPEEPPKKLGLVGRFKQMYKEYWYVLVPVHLVTSIGWFTTFYYMAKRYYR